MKMTLSYTILALTFFAISPAFAQKREVFLSAGIAQTQFVLITGKPNDQLTQVVTISNGKATVASVISSSGMGLMSYTLSDGQMVEIQSVSSCRPVLKRSEMREVSVPNDSPGKIHPLTFSSDEAIVGLVKNQLSDEYQEGMTDLVFSAAGFIFVVQKEEFSIGKIFKIVGQVATLMEFEVMSDQEGNNEFTFIADNSILKLSSEGKAEFHEPAIIAGTKTRQSVLIPYTLTHDAGLTSVLQTVGSSLQLKVEAALTAAKAGVCPALSGGTIK